MDKKRVEEDPVNRDPKKRKPGSRESVKVGSGREDFRGMSGPRGTKRPHRGYLTK